MQSVKLKNLPERKLFTVDYLPGIKLMAVSPESGFYAEIEYSDGILKPYCNVSVSLCKYIWLNDNQFVTIVSSIEDKYKNEDDTDHSIFGWYNN